MNLKGLDLFLLTKLTSHQVDHVTCLECCKYYIAPETAPCGHSLCHTCWRGRRTCPSCAAPLEKKSLKLNLPLQNLTEHIHALGEAFEKLFNIKLDEFVLDGSSNEIEPENDPTKNVTDWLASSQNQFSAPLINSEQFSEDVNPVEISSSKIQVHMDSKKSKSPVKVVYKQQPQDDWDKIEQLPDTEEICVNNKENSTNPINKQSSFIQDKEYTTDNPRRSSRKREMVSTDPINSSHDMITEKSSKNTSSETDKKSSKTKQNWNNVKRMRKEFSKLNKKNRSKLNVSIEMCKKTQSTAKPNIDLLEHVKTSDKESQPPIYTIEDTTPDINTNNDKQMVISEPVQSINSQKIYENHIYNKVPTSVADDFNSNNIKSSSNKNNHDENYEGSPHNIQETKGLQDETDKVNHSTITKMPFIKKGILYPQESQNKQIFNPPINIQPENTNGDDDIEITIKIGNTLTNITIKKKNNDVQLRVNTDREVQTSLGPNCLVNKKSESSTMTENKSQNIEINIGKDNVVSASTTQPENVKMNVECNNILNKSASTKKNTASAETATAQFEITESVEKELSNIMECTKVADSGSKNNVDKDKIIFTNEISQQPPNAQIEDHGEDYINDLDIFDNGSVHGQNVQLLNKSKQAPSEILMSTVTNTKKQTQKHPDKRDRDGNEEYEEPCAKKVKTVSDNAEEEEKNLNDTLNATHKDIIQNSESINYDVVMGQVFASIDADIEMSQKTGKHNKEEMIADVEIVMQSQCLQSKTQTKGKQVLSTQGTRAKNVETNVKEVAKDKYSENVFSIIEKDDETEDVPKKTYGKDGSTQQHIENLLTPGICQDLISTHEDNLELADKTQCTPFQEHYDSDKSVVEETPQKNVSIPKQKSTSEFINNTSKQKNANLGVSKAVSYNSQVGRSVINVSDTLVDTTKDQTIVEVATKKLTLETPLTINKFVDHIKHNSTPMARKSLNFKNVEDVDPQQTQCPSTYASKTTQEKEFMSKAFEKTQKSPIKKPTVSKIINPKELNYCIAGSCLTAAEITNVKLLCKRFNWKYLDKYTKELTHLVVGVDEENRSQRSVKYMCALAASKWIVSYDWVKACLVTNMVAGENLYEALDGTGEPGPRRSRMAKGKLFEGITFFCMPPFSVLDVDALKQMLESAGGRVVDEAKAVRAASEAPALLLAEPEHTQEDRFVYLALELNIVPVNYEWVLNCLGSYTLSSIYELLLCPAALLPPITNSWPPALMSRDSY
ncbi:hypothetical protein ABMA27_002098 [Loxostege sticticalis]|uniref:Breast cancer type 1 susceptibility protein homolog n=1 Tax=Loxostege sticticalis TaxID=481309 RepID=A0ABR3HWJ9_LOXSC